jgi:hypothetical protein
MPENRRGKWVVEEIVVETIKGNEFTQWRGGGVVPALSVDRRTDYILICWALGRITTAHLRRACLRTDVGVIAYSSEQRVGFPNA